MNARLYYLTVADKKKRYYDCRGDMWGLDVPKPMPLKDLLLRREIFSEEDILELEDGTQIPVFFIL